MLYVISSADVTSSVINLWVVDHWAVVELGELPAHGGRRRRTLLLLFLVSRLVSGLRPFLVPGLRRPARQRGGAPRVLPEVPRGARPGSPFQRILCRHFFKPLYTVKRPLSHGNL